MENREHKFRLYQRLQQHSPEIYAEMKRQAEAIAIPQDLRGRIGLGGGSGSPPTLAEDVMDAICTISRKAISLGTLVDEIRDLVKDVYGDHYDAAPVSTAEAALWVAFDTLVSPPMQGRGDNYRSAYLAPYERHLHHQGGYGRPLPPHYKDLFGDRGTTAGEFGIQGKRLNNVETIIVPLEGARYEAHGIKYHVVPLLTKVNPELSVKKIKNMAERHIDRLAAFTSLGYDTPGYGYGIKDDDNTPKLQRYIGSLAEEYNIPYICDNARGLPFAGTDPRKILASVMIYSMDKAAGAPTSGLIIGDEDVMVPIRKAMGMHGSRKGTVSSYGKAGYVMADPGKEALAGLIVALRTLKEHPDIIVNAMDSFFRIVREEFASINCTHKERFIISKSVNGALVEVNYENTWEGNNIGIPIFSIEDMYAGSNLIQEGLRQMGIMPPLGYDGNITLNVGQGTLDEEGNLIEDRAILAVKALVKVVEIIDKWTKKGA